MKDIYPIQASSSYYKFEFYSEGINGRIKKQVIFKAFPEDNTVYNLGFGDVTETGDINDVAITNNGDKDKVLKTVCVIVLQFLTVNHNKFVFAIGSSFSRTRLYNMGISKYLEILSEEVLIFGFKDEKWEEFKKGNNYGAFLVKKR